MYWGREIQIAGQRTTFNKLQRERAKKAKAAEKRERRQERAATAAAGGTEVLERDRGGELSAPELLKLIEAIHQSYDAGTISYEQFEEKKAELMARLPVD
jgi:hypothetical protein